MITKAFKHNKLLHTLQKVTQRSFSMTSPSESEEASGEVRPKINPLKREVTDFLKNVSQYEEQVEDVLNPYYIQTDKLKGFATEQGTDNYYRKSQQEDLNLEVHPENFKYPFNTNIKLSSIGYGTYMGDPDDYTDYLMYDAMKTSILSGGINHIDTAPNYRYMKSEKTVGRLLTTLDNKYGIKRDQLFLTSKAGYIPEDAEKMISRTEMSNMLVKKAGVPEADIVKESAHCMHPNFLKHQLESTLDRMNVQCLDVFYLQNPYESQGPYNTDNVFFDRLTAAFEFLEEQVQQGKIQNYGLATYSSFRVKPTEEKMHLNLQKVIKLAEKVGGEKTHHMRYIQAPINMIMPEAFVEPWQALEEKDTGIIRQKMLAAVCSELEINLISSQPLLQGMTANIPLSRSNVSVYNIPARHLQLIRSIPSKAIKSTLVGMKDPVNVRANLEVIKKPLMKRQEFFDTLRPHRRAEYIDEELEM